MPTLSVRRRRGEVTGCAGGDGVFHSIRRGRRRRPEWEYRLPEEIPARIARFTPKAEPPQMEATEEIPARIAWLTQKPEF